MNYPRFGRYPYFFAFAVLLACMLVLSPGCMENGDAEKQELADRSGDSGTVRLVYVDWASEKASTHVVKTVIETRLNRECELLSVSLIAMWESLAAGDQDASVSAWLPTLQKSYLSEHQDEVDNLGPNLENTRMGLVVPQYVPVDSIAGLKKHAGKFGSRIIGIDPYAGIMEKTRQAMDAYGLSGFELISGSGQTMTTALEKAIADDRWIVVTGWTPHWKFAQWDLKYLSDPKTVYGRREHIATIARKGLQKDMPEVYAFLDNFYWHPADMAEVMHMAREKKTTYSEAARNWVTSHPGRVDGWVRMTPDPNQGKSD